MQLLGEIQLELKQHCKESVNLQTFVLHGK